MSFVEYLAGRWDDLLELTVEHVVLVLTAMAIGTALALAIGVLTYRSRLSDKAIAVAALLITIPSLALYALLIGPLGLGSPPAVVALVLYAQLSILRNTVVGLRGVDAAIVESAQGMGMGKWQRLARIELPLAWPVILTGIRVSTLIVIGIAAIAAVVNAPGLGKDIFRGLARIGSPTALNLVLGGTLGVVVVGILFDAVFNIVGKLTTSRGIR
jgi:osmoprotectant transport system permease protein